MCVVCGNLYKIIDSGVSTKTRNLVVIKIINNLYSLMCVVCGNLCKIIDSGVSTKTRNLVCY